MMLFCQDQGGLFAKKDYIPSIRMLRTHRAARTLASILLALFASVLLTLIFAPWQQTASGIGRVVAYNPLDRQQMLSAPVKGRILKWNVTEGSWVKKGQIIAQMEDNDPQAMTRIQQQKQAAIEQEKLSEQQADAYLNKINSLKASRQLQLRANSLKIKMAQQKYQVVQQKLKATVAALRVAEINYQRQKKLRQENIVSIRTLEVSELKVAKLRAEENALRADLLAAQAEIVATRAMRLKKAAEDQSKIDSALAEFQKSKNNAAYSKSAIAKIELAMGRQASQIIRAPRDAAVLRLLVTQQSELLKPGDPIAILVPQTQNFSVELWIDGNDVPLITPGRHVRLQFEGWPAIQFSGWPSVAVGTFGGLVYLIDVANSANGKFRVLVKPDAQDAAWPNVPYLRQGMKVKGWIFLNNVRLGYEIWRQLNGFPPSFDRPLQPSSKGSPAKPGTKKRK